MLILQQNQTGPISASLRILNAAIVPLHSPVRVAAFIVVRTKTNPAPLKNTPPTNIPINHISKSHFTKEYYAYEKTLRRLRHSHYTPLVGHLNYPRSGGSPVRSAVRWFNLALHRRSDHSRYLHVNSADPGNYRPRAPNLPPLAPPC